jgi:hypothetical protein
VGAVKSASFPGFKHSAEKQAKKAAEKSSRKKQQNQAAEFFKTVILMRKT